MSNSETEYLPHEFLLEFLAEVIAIVLAF